MSKPDAGTGRREEIPGDYQYRALHQGPISQRRWHQEKLDLLERHLRGRAFGRICDVGCGSGIVAQRVAALCPQAEVVALDQSQACVDFAGRQYAALGNLRFVAADVLAGVSGLGPFDLVYSTEVIEHFSRGQVASYLDALKSLGGPGASFLLTTPDYGTPYRLIEKALDFFSCTPPLLGHQHLTPLTKGLLADLLGESGFTVKAMANFCGWSTFLAHLSLGLAQAARRREIAGGKGFLIWCEFQAGS